MKPCNDFHMRSWEECRYAWLKLSGEDLSRQMITKIANRALAKIRRRLQADGLWSELESHL